MCFLYRVKLFVIRGAFVIMLLADHHRDRTFIDERNSRSYCLPFTAFDITYP